MGLIAIAFVAILLVLGGVLFFRLRIDPPSAGGGSASQPALVPEKQAVDGGPASAPALQSGSAAVGTREGMDNVGFIEVPEHLPYKDERFVFEGATAKITGYLEEAQGRPFPETWKLLVEPSAHSIGSRDAARREFEYTGNQRTFEVLDLPLGGYRVSVQAEGFDVRSQEVLLFRLEGRPAHEGKLHAHLAMRLHSAAPISGVITRADGAPAADLAVTVEELGTGLRRTATSNGTGAWSVRNLRMGRYRLLVGPPTQPLLSVPEIVHDARQREPLQHELPPLVSVRLIVIDGDGFRQGGISVRGHGPSPIDAITEPDGSVLLAYLPAGRYEVRGEDPIQKDEGRLTMVVRPDEPEQQFELVLARRGG